MDNKDKTFLNYMKHSIKISYQLGYSEKTRDELKLVKSSIQIGNIMASARHSKRRELIDFIM